MVVVVVAAAAVVVVVMVMVVVRGGMLAFGCIEHTPSAPSTPNTKGKRFGAARVYWASRSRAAWGRHACMLGVFENWPCSCKFVFLCGNGRKGPRRAHKNIPVKKTLPFNQLWLKAFIGF